MSGGQAEVIYDPVRGAIVHIPTECPVCGTHVGGHLDVHMALIHPEQCPAIVAMRAHRAAMEKTSKKSGKKSSKKKR